MSGHKLSELQLEVMQVLWDLGEATSGQVCDALASSRQLAPTTVATLLKRLEEKGAVTHRKEGRSFVYSAQVARKTVRAGMVGGLIQKLFLGDPAALVNHLLGDEGELKDGDRKRIVELLEEARTNEAGNNEQGKRS
ncbi:MAG: BlaI/MecI/CopY family transcriptional regulator [Pseudomonadota bacterium]